MVTTIKEWASKQSATFPPALCSFIAKIDGMKIFDWLLLFSPYLTFSRQFHDFLIEHRHTRTCIQ